jgi:hypothetical protein
MVGLWVWPHNMGAGIQQWAWPYNLGPTLVIPDWPLKNLDKVLS